MITHSQFEVTLHSVDYNCTRWPFWKGVPESALLEGTAEWQSIQTEGHSWGPVTQQLFPLGRVPTEEHDVPDNLSVAA